MDEKELNKYKKAEKIINPNDLTESKTIKFRKNKKVSIDVKYQKRLDTVEEAASYFEKYGVRNKDGGRTIGRNDQLIKQYMNRLYSILESIGMPSDDRVKYRSDGELVAFNSDEMGYHLSVYLMTDKFANIPNVQRIGKLLTKFRNIKASLQKGEFEAVVNSLLFAIEEYSNIILISIEGDIVPHTTGAATQKRMEDKQKRINDSHALADKIKEINPHLSKSALAKRISEKTGWSIETVRQVYLKDYQK